MNQQIQGVVERYIERDRNWTDKKTGQPRSAKAYQVVVGGVEYGSFNEPLQGAFEGANVQFAARQNGQYWNIVKNSFVVLGGAPAPQPAAPQSQPAQPQVAHTHAAAPVQSKEAYWKEKDMLNDYKGCRNAALQHVQILVDAGALELPSGKTKIAEKLSLLEGAIDAYTRSYLAELENVKLNGLPKVGVEGFMDGLEDEDADV